MLYQLPPPCYPIIFPSLSLTSLSYFPSYHFSIPPSSLSLPTYVYIPIPIYLCIIAADPGAGIGLVKHDSTTLSWIMRKLNRGVEITSLSIYSIIRGLLVACVLRHKRPGFESVCYQSFPSTMLQRLIEI